MNRNKFAVQTNGSLDGGWKNLAPIDAHICFDMCTIAIPPNNDKFAAHLHSVRIASDDVISPTRWTVPNFAQTPKKV